MRSDETKAITITLPKALFESVQARANRDECGNVSAVIRKVLYKDLDQSTPLVLKDGDAARIAESEIRSQKYKVNRLRKNP